MKQVPPPLIKLSIGRNTRPNYGIMKEMTRTLWQRIMVRIETRPHQGRVVKEGLCATFNLKLKADVEQTTKWRKPCKQREQYVQRA